MELRLHSQNIMALAKMVTEPGHLSLMFSAEAPKEITLLRFDPFTMGWEPLGTITIGYKKPTRDRNKKGVAKATPSNNETKIDDPRQEELPSPPSDQPPASSEADQTPPKKNARGHR